MELGRIQAVQDVHLEAAPEMAADLRWFYGEVAGLDEETYANDQDVLRFKAAQIELAVHLVRDPPSPDLDRRLSLALPSLAAVAEALDERSWPHTIVRGLAFTDRRLYALDPAGYRIEFRRLWPRSPL